VTGAKVPSAIVCTRNRPDDIVRAVRSILESPEDFELLVVDQSDGPETENALATFATDRRLHYVRSNTRGKGAALNEGLRLARSDVLICTDDDCEAEPGWVSAMATVFDEAPTAAVAFCRVEAPPYDPNAGYVPESTEPRRVLRSLRELCGTRGMGAGMALRRDVMLELGGVDELFGPGARFMSADDVDVAARVILLGWHVYTTGDRRVIHHGFRTLREGREHARRDYVGIGAACAKPIRAGRLRAIRLAGWEFGHALWPPIADALRLRRPRGLARITGFIAGFAGGMRLRVDGGTLRFVDASRTRGESEPAASDEMT
jgi:glycosyltransferase involved in cell wall biosynthesis